MALARQASADGSVTAPGHGPASAISLAGSPQAVRVYKTVSKAEPALSKLTVRQSVSVSDVTRSGPELAAQVPSLSGASALESPEKAPPAPTSPGCAQSSAV